MTPNRKELQANGDDLVYVTVQIADKNGNIIPTENRLVKFKVEGAGTFEATANGDATCLLPFHEPKMNLFSGAATMIARSAKEKGNLIVKASAPGVKDAILSIPVK